MELEICYHGNSPLTTTTTDWCRSFGKEKITIFPVSSHPYSLPSNSSSLSKYLESSHLWL